MRTLIVLLITLGLAYGGYMLWQQTTSPETEVNRGVTDQFETPNLSLQDSQSVLSNLESVLGASISNGVEVVSGALSTVTGGKSEPIINNAISNFQKELSSLPEDQVKKIQYNYCNTIVEEYENQP